MKRWHRKWRIAVGLVFLLASRGHVLGASVEIPPVGENFQSGELPHIRFVPLPPPLWGYWIYSPWSFETNGTARTIVAADETALETRYVPPSAYSSSAASGGNRVRGEFYRCDSTAVLTEQAIELGRSSSGTVRFAVYESTTSNGVYSILSSNTIPVGVGTNWVSVSGLNVPMKAGRYYLLVAGWNQPMTYAYRSAATFPLAVPFGEAFAGYAGNVFPPPASVSSAFTSSAYFQRLTFSTNAVVRMDDSGGDSVRSTNRMDLALNLYGLTDVELSFRHRQSGDEQDLADGIFMSDDSGNSFSRIYELDGSSTWETITLDIDALASSHGLSLNSNVVIRFQQSDDWPWPYDGREFDDVKLYATAPDLAISAAGASSSVLWRGFSGTRSLPVSVSWRNRGSDTDQSEPSIGLWYGLRDVSSGNLLDFEVDTEAWGVGAMQTVYQNRSHVLTFPASLHLSNLYYTAEAFLDAYGDVSEARENNNYATYRMTVNHYSGRLWFANVWTDVTISDWGTRVADSPTEHWITGTGTIAGETFSFTHLDVTKEPATLDYRVASSETNVIPVSIPGREEVAGISYWHENGIELSKDGVHGDVFVLLPAGFGATTNADPSLMSPVLVFESESLGQTLYPTSSVSVAGPFLVAEETKPLALSVDEILWTPEAGTFSCNASGNAEFVRSELYDQLESEPGNMANPAMAHKKSNALYYRFVSGTLGDVEVRAGSRSEALMSVELGCEAGDFRTHFPYDVTLDWNDAFRLEILDDLVSAGVASPNHFDNASIDYARDCSSTNCSGAAGRRTVGMLLKDPAFVDPCGGWRLSATTDGAFLEWGARSDGYFAQETERFDGGVLYVPGTFVLGEQSGFDASENEGPAEILLSGICTNGTDFERPSSASYAAGTADYAGLNLRVGSAGLGARSTLGGTDTGWWGLSARSKYYVRWSGVSGIHEARPGSFPSSLTIYGYPFGFSNYGLSYLSNDPDESRINGTVSVGEPIDVSLDFKNMMLCCLGELEEADLANASLKTLAYWDADFLPQSLFFAPTSKSTCANAARKLCVGLTTRCSNFDVPLSGVLAFMENGVLGTPADEIEGVPSRLSVPNAVKLDGPNAETYYFNPVAMPYYNDYAKSGDSMSKRGWINFAGNLDVAFFNDLHVHLHTSAGTNSTLAAIHMMGGWEEAGKTFFNSDVDDFDRTNAGFPYAAVSYEQYRSPSTDAYRVHAERDWLNVVHFDYPLQWSSASKSFKSPDTISNNLLVVKVQHQTDYLSAKNAEISFGMQYDGVPQINLANMAFNALDEATGMASAFTRSVGDLLRDTIDMGMDAFSDTLSDLANQLIDPVLDPLLDPLIDDFYADLYEAYTNAASPGADYYSAVITNYLYVSVGKPYENVQYVLQHLSSDVGTATNILSQVNTNLARAVRMIDAFTGLVNVDTNGIALPSGSNVVGLINFDHSGDYEQLADLGIGILKELASTLYDSVKDDVEQELNKQLESAKPSLESISATLIELRGVITNVQAQLTTAGNLGAELDTILNNPLVMDPVNLASAQIDVWFKQLDAGDARLEEYAPEEVKAMLRRQIKDAFYGSVPCADVQQAIRSRLYEVESAVDEGIDSAFQQLNKALRDFIGQYVAKLDDKINGALGDLGNCIGAGQIEGYAHIRDDTLVELRVDGKFQWKVPKEMDFNAYLIIKQLDSKMAGACGMAGATLPEVTVGTTDMEMNMLESKIRADISAKVAFISTNGMVYPIGLGGSFNMKEGKIGFESFAITRLYAAVAFGKMENYLSAAVKCEFTDYEVEGGVFFGKTCTLDPFSWDPDVKEILGDPPFTGIYVYGQGWIPVPIVDYGCVLQIRVGLGAGIFAFLEGPVGGKVYMGLDGTALCVVNVGAEVTLVGLKDGDDLRMKGKGKVRGRVGACPFCIKFSKTIGITYDNGDWGVDL